MANGLRRKPPTDFSLLWQIVRKHLLVFLMTFALGFVFTAVSLGLLYFYGLSQIMILLFGLLFLLAGIFIIGFAFVSSFNSVIYYYQKGAVVRHGLNLNAILTRKERDETYIDDPEDRRHRVHVDELELRVYFTFQFDGADWELCDLLNSEALYDMLQEGQTIPIRILPWRPESASVRQRALLNQLKRKDIISPQVNPRIGQKIIEFDEI